MTLLQTDVVDVPPEGPGVLETPDSRDLVVVHVFFFFPQETRTRQGRVETRFRLLEVGTVTG